MIKENSSLHSLEIPKAVESKQHIIDGDNNKPDYE
jgi:hypothetical protein